MTVDQLWTKYQRERSSSCRNDLVAYYMPFARQQISKVQRTIAVRIEENELIGAACLGLMSAVEAFDPARKIRFESFSSFRVRGAILDWLREIDTQGRTVRVFENKKRKAEQELEYNKCSSADIAAKMDMSVKRYEHLNALLHRGNLASLDSLAAADSYSWNLVDKKNGVDPTLTTRMRFLRELITKGMKRTDRMILYLYLFDGLTMREIGQILDVTESRIYQIYKKSIVRIQAILKGRNDL